MPHLLALLPLEALTTCIIYQYMSQRCHITVNWAESWWITMPRQTLGTALVAKVENQACTRVLQSGVSIK